MPGMHNGSPVALGGAPGDGDRDLSALRVQEGAGRPAPAEAGYAGTPDEAGTGVRVNATDEYLEACVQDAKEILSDSHDGDARFLAFRLLELVAIHQETLGEIAKVVEMPAKGEEFTDELVLHVRGELNRRFNRG